MPVPLLLLLLGLLSPTAADDAACAACTGAVKRLAGVFRAEKKELELSKEAIDKKAQKIDKVQKAQTKRWLKNEYGVALRASVEDAMESLCGRDIMTSSRELTKACLALLEEHEEDLPRAILDEKHEGFCAKAVPGCEGEAAEKAVAAFKRSSKSEKEPKGKAAKKVRGVVTRLVGTTFSKAVRTSGEHALVLLHNGSASKEKAYEVSSMRYAALTSEFYALAVAANNSKCRIGFSQLDLAKNDVPTNTPLADPSGVGLVLYLIGDRDEPKAMPEMGEAALSFAEAPALRSQLTQFLLTYLPKKDGSALGRVVKEREELQNRGEGLKQAAKAKAADAKAAGAGAAAASSESAAEGAAAAAAAAVASKPAAPSARRSASKAADPRRPLEQCDVCALLMGQLKRALVSTQEELELSKEANDKKAEKIDKVQKAQTKRWLKNEYRVALAAAVEEKLDNVCDDKALLLPVCKATANATADGEGSSGGSGASGGSGESGGDELAWPAAESGKVGVAACQDRGKSRCRTVVDDHAEPLMRAVLDNRDAAECAKLLPQCDASRLLALAARVEALEPPKAEVAEGDGAPSPAPKPTPKDEV